MVSVGIGERVKPNWEELIWRLEMGEVCKHA